MLFFSAIVSIVTEMLFRMRKVYKDHNEYMDKLREYFRQHHVSQELMLRVKRHVEARKHWKEHAVHETDVLEPLPDQLRRSLLVDVRSPCVERHCLMYWLKEKHTLVFREVVHSVLTVTQLPPDQSLFVFGDTCQNMIFVQFGRAKYIMDRHTRVVKRESLFPTFADPQLMATKAPADNVELVKASWCCEPALWLRGWQNRGSLITVSHSCFLCLDSARFALVSQRLPRMYLDMGLYARTMLRHVKRISATDDLAASFHADAWAA